MMKNILIILLLVSCNSLAQNYFEGEIHFKNETIKKDSSFDLTKIISYPSKKSIFYFKNGDWIQRPDTGLVEYQYFNHNTNKQFYKLHNWDTILYYKYDKLTPEQDSIISVAIHNNTDTILGKKCNSLSLQTPSTKFTFVYDPEIIINPDWFSKTKGGYYDVIYGKMKSIYLKVVIETDRYISIVTAEKIIKRSIPDETFPSLVDVPLKEL